MRRTARRGYTLFEVMVILAVLIILGAVLSQTFDGMHSNTRQKAAADTIRARISDARAKAMEQGTWYRLAVHADGTRIRLAPDGPDFASLTPDDPPAFDSRVTEDKLDPATAELQPDPDHTHEPDSGGWITIATVGPYGICKEDGATVVVKERDFQPLLIRVRGVTGTATRPILPKNGGRP
jgi:type II secretory pathway pseudopilin PulG